MSFTAQMRAAGASAILATGLAAAAPARAVTLTDSFQVRATVIAACDLRLDPAVIPGGLVPCLPAPGFSAILPPPPRRFVQQDETLGQAVTVIEF